MGKKQQTNIQIIMKKSFLIVLVFMAIAGRTAPTNCNDKILYIFPDDVEIAINDYIEKYADKESLQFVLTLYKDEAGTYKVYVNSYRTDSGNSKHCWEQATNRFAVVNNNEYPLLFDYDYDFSTTKPSEIGEYGQREGQVLKIMSINDGFYVKFSKSGICVK